MAESTQRERRKYPMHPVTQVKKGFLVALMLASFGLAQVLEAVNPPPDGDYPGANTAEGQEALLNLTTGDFNTAVGWLSLATVTSCQLNTAIGAGTLLVNTANGNTATGAGALLSNTTGFGNTANGTYALSSNTTGNHNTAVGREALSSKTTGGSNTAIGRDALLNNHTSNNNTAVGREALLNNTNGQSNVAVGRSALANNTTGVTNIALGTDSGSSVTTASNVVCIGFGVGGANLDQTTWIGNIYGVTTQSGTTAPVIVSDTGQLGTVVSSERFKKDIATMEKTSEAILALRPVTFHYKSDSNETPQFGLIAEEVAKVNPALVLPDKTGKPYTVRYDAVNAMVLNEFLKEHLMVQNQGATIAQQEKEIKALKQELKAQASLIHEVSSQLKLGKFATGRTLRDQPEAQAVQNDP
jgi:Chaperone of endosialidase